MSRLVSFLLLLPTLAAGAAVPLPPETGNPPTVPQELALRQELVADPVEVVVLGTFHFANPGRDVVNVDAGDVLSPAKQEEIAAVVGALKRFAPTKVAVENPVERADALNELYRRFVSGDRSLGRSEEEQIGMRLAAEMEHERLYPIDVSGDLDFPRVFAAAAEQDPALAARLQQLMPIVGERIQRIIDGKTIGEALLAINDPEWSRVAHGVYLELAHLGAGEKYEGADLAADWYVRNLKIFANLAKIAQPGDRIVVVYGAGHEPLLRHFVESTPGFDAVPVSEVLRGSLRPSHSSPKSATGDPGDP